VGFFRRWGFQLGVGVGARQEGPREGDAKDLVCFALSGECGCECAEAGTEGGAAALDALLGPQRLGGDERVEHLSALLQRVQIPPTWVHALLCEGSQAPGARRLYFELALACPPV
jgi:hypothetical protein